MVGAESESWLPRRSILPPGGSSDGLCGSLSPELLSGLTAAKVLAMELTEKLRA